MSDFARRPKFGPHRYRNGQPGSLEPDTMLCKVIHKGKVIGYVVTSTKMNQWPFQRKLGYSVQVLRTSRSGIKNLLYDVRVGKFK